jgi:hypothetical protein
MKDKQKKNRSLKKRKMSDIDLNRISGGSPASDAYLKQIKDDIAAFPTDTIWRNGEVNPAFTAAVKTLAGDRTARQKALVRRGDFASNGTYHWNNTFKTSILGEDW